MFMWLTWLTYFHTALICSVIRAQATPRAVHETAFAGVSQNLGISCTNEETTIPEGAAVFWIINGSVYGILQVPPDYEACSSEDCLIILTVTNEMNGSTFQCVATDYHSNIQYLGVVTKLTVIALPNGTFTGKLLAS